MTQSRWMLGAALLAACAADVDGPKVSGDLTGDDLANVVPDGAADVARPSPLKGTLELEGRVGGVLDGERTYHLWDLRMGVSGRVRLDLGGQEGADTYLTLYRRAGAAWVRVASNDDCGSALSSCLERELGAGDYRVLATTYDAVALGRYPETPYALSASCTRGRCVASLCGTGGDARGPSDFVSADYYTPSPVFGPLFRTADAEGGSAREVVEGDIYESLGDGYLLDFNPYRGLQVIDVRDASRPTVVGRVAAPGYPVELYVVDHVAYALLNGYQEYRPNGDGLRTTSYDGGLLLAVDVSDPAAPREISRVRVPGSISTSRLTRGSGAVALYVAGLVSREVTTPAGSSWESRTLVTSFALDAGVAEQVGELDLGGWVQAIEATPEVLLVARADGSGDPRSLVSVIDISDPHGRMVQGGQVTVAGQVQSKQNLDYRNGVVRVVSGRTWGETVNSLQTFDRDSLAELGRCDFGAGQSLFATMFMDDRAFFVTYQRVDPFHAFALDAAGGCQERSEFVVSGWNDFFRPVQQDRRLVGVGIDDGGGRFVSLSLYDTTDLDNANPLLARARAELPNAWTEASWDDRAVSIVEDAVSARAADGTTETGLALVPLGGWDPETNTYRSLVQIFTFSDHTLTSRGLLDHGTPARRSFLTEPTVAASLSDSALRLHDTTDLDRPALRGELELAPNFTSVTRVRGNVGARLASSVETYYGWYAGKAELPSSTVEIFSGSADSDALSVIEVPAQASILGAGGVLTVTNARANDAGQNVTTVTTYDVSTPSAPRLLGTAETTAIRAQDYSVGPLLASARCRRWPCRPTSSVERFAVGDSLVLLERLPVETQVGEEESCTSAPRAEDTQLRGSISCIRTNGGEPSCYGEIQACETTDAGESCRVVDPATLTLERTCTTYPIHRSSQAFTAHVLDLTRPAAPRFREPLSISGEAVNAVVSGASLWLGTKQLEPVDAEGRARARFFATRLDLAAPWQPELGPAVNVPGVFGGIEGRTLYTREAQHEGAALATDVVRSVVCRGRAYRQAGHRFVDRDVQSAMLDGAGHVLVGTRLTWEATNALGIGTPTQQLVVLDATSLSSISESNVDDWAELRGAAAGRALYSVTGGLVLVSTADGARPRARAYFATQGWPQSFLLSEDRVLFAAGRYGVYDLPANVSNLE